MGSRAQLSDQHVTSSLNAEPSDGSLHINVAISCYKHALVAYTINATVLMGVHSLDPKKDI